MTAEVKACTVCRAAGETELVLSKERESPSSFNLQLYRCLQCGSVYLGSYDETYSDELYDYYQGRRSKTKEELFDPVTRSSYDRVLRMFAANCDGRDVLDVGCGLGSFVDAALNSGYRAQGIDLAKPAIEIARGFGLPVSELDFFSSDIAKSSKDIVTMFEVIEHVPDPVAFLRRAEEVVRPGGLVYLTTPNFASIDRRVLGANWKAIHPEHLTYFTPQTLLGAVRNGTSLDLTHIETRNVSGELLAKFRRLTATMRARGERPCGAADGAVAQNTDAFRARVEASSGLRLLKRMANGVLNALSLGTTIVLLLRRPGGVRGPG